MQTFTKVTGAPGLVFIFAGRRLWESGRFSLYRAVKRGGIFMGNHTSLWDPILMGWLVLFREIRFWAAEVMFEKNRFCNWFFKAMGFIRVDRSISDMASVQEAIDTLEAGGIMGVFPEGRLNREQPEMLPFHPGVVIIALKTGKPIIPIYSNGGYHIRKRLRYIIGDPIYLRDRYPDAELTPEFLAAVSAELREKLASLGARVSGCQ